MIKQSRIILAVIILIGILLTKFWYEKKTFEKAKEITVIELENYKLSHSIYPTDLKELKIYIPKEFYYSSDSTRQTYFLSYAQGIMEVNTIVFDSKTKKWTKKFNY